MEHPRVASVIFRLRLDRATNRKAYAAQISGRQATPASRYTPAHRRKYLQVPACGPTTFSPRIACQTQMRDKPIKQIGTPVLCRRSSAALREQAPTELPMTQLRPNASGSKAPHKPHQDRLSARVPTVPSAGALGMALLATAHEAYHLIMSRLHPERHDSDPSDRSIAANVLVRQEPDEEEDDEEDDGGGKEDDDDEDRDDDGYSE
jgi:hypothetical protein